MAIVIKNVPEDKWRIFKSEAARRGMNLGEYFGELIDEHLKKEERTDIDKILCGKPTLTEKEANIMRKASSKIRKNFHIRV